MNVWLVMLATGIITYLIRLSFIMLFGRMNIPPRLRQALRFVPPAVLTAIVFPELLIRDGSLSISIGNIRLLAGLLAAIVAWKTRNVLLTIVAGMLALYILQALLP